MTNNKILVSIITIDRDAYAIEMVYNSIKHLLDNKNTNLLIICRKTDNKCIRGWKKLHNNVIIKTVLHYNIDKRHNYDAITKKRNIARKYALDNNYDYLFFIDSDVIINKNTFTILCDANADVCLVPYHVKWHGKTCIGVADDTTESGFAIKNIQNDGGNIEYKDCAIGGMGCTLLRKKALLIPFEYKELHNGKQFVYGEDIGYFLMAHKNNLVIKYVTNHEITHL